MSDYTNSPADATAEIGNGMRVEITTREDAMHAPIFVLLIGQHDFYLYPSWDAGLGQWYTEVNLSDEDYDLRVYADGTVARVA